jgi:hypothetical protein
MSDPRRINTDPIVTDMSLTIITVCTGATERDEDGDCVIVRVALASLELQSTHNKCALTLCSIVECTIQKGPRTWRPRKQRKNHDRIKQSPTHIFDRLDLGCAHSGSYTIGEMLDVIRTLEVLLVFARGRCEGVLRHVVEGIQSRCAPRESDPVICKARVVDGKGLVCRTFLYI